MLTQLILCHLVGDFLFQNHWMQNKSKDTFVCLVHVLCYFVPFGVFVAVNLLPAPAALLILVEHFLQDRFTLHMKWMKLHDQSTKEQWPVGPLIIDQVWHMAFIWIVAMIWGLV